VAAKCDANAYGTQPAESSAFTSGNAAFVGNAMAGATLQNGMNRVSHVRHAILSTARP